MPDISTCTVRQEEKSEKKDSFTQKTMSKYQKELTVPSVLLVGSEGKPGWHGEARLSAGDHPKVLRFDRPI